MSAKANFLTQSNFLLCAGLVKNLASALKWVLEFYCQKGPKTAKNGLFCYKVLVSGKTTCHRAL